MTAATGGAGIAQRTFGAAPGTGTLTTAAPVAAWAASTAYVVDPTSGGTSRVLNGGNIYQCRTGGTSAGSGGPTGTGTNITDNTAHWTFEGASEGSNTAAGSQILGVIARGTQSAASSIAPTDNDSGSYTVILNTAYSGFPDSFAGVWRRSTAANTKTNFAASAIWGPENTNQGDEVTVGWIELTGVTVGAPHASSQVERASATANVVTAANITTTVQCLVVSFWFGNGNVITTGTSHPATPNGGLTLIPGFSALMAISGGYIQCAAAWRIANAGTFAESWTTTGEGAQLITVAFPVATALPGNDEDLPPALPSAFDWRRVAAAAALVAQLTVQGTPVEELPIASTAIVEDDPAIAVVAAPRAVVPVAVAPVDEIAAAPALGDDDAVAARLPAPAPRPTLAFVADDEIVVAPPEEVVSVAVPAWNAPVRRVDVAVDDEIVGVAVLDDDQVAAQPTGRPAPAAPAAFADDELAQVPALDDEPVVLVSSAQAVPLARAPIAAADDELPALAAVEDDPPIGAPVAIPRVAVAATALDDELAQPPIAEDDPIAVIAAAAPPRTASSPATVSDEVPGTAAVAEDDPVPAPNLARAPSTLPTTPTTPSDDELPIAAVVGDDEGMPAPLATSTARAAPMVMLSADELPAVAVEDDPAVAAVVPTPTTSPLTTIAVDDDLPPSIALDDDPAGPRWTPPLVAWAAVMAIADELPVAAGIDDDPVAVATPPAARTVRALGWVPDDETPPPAQPPLTFEDDPLAAAQPPMPRRRVILFWPADEIAGAAPPVVVIEPKGTRVQRTEIVVILTPAPSVRVVPTAAVVRLVGVAMADPEPFRQGHTHRPLTAVAFTTDRMVDFPAEFPGGVTFRAVNGTHVITGPATGDSAGNLTYIWAATDLDVVGHWKGYFEATDGVGKTETFPDGALIEYDVVATI